MELSSVGFTTQPVVIDIHTNPLLGEPLLKPILNHLTKIYVFKDTEACLMAIKIQSSHTLQRFKQYITRTNVDEQPLEPKSHCTKHY